MTEEQLKSIFNNLDDGKKEVLSSMIPDFLFEQEQIEKIKEALLKIGIPTNKTKAEQKKYLSKEYSDLSQRHDSKIKIILSTLGKFDVKEESPLMEMLKQFE